MRYVRVRSDAELSEALQLEGAVVLAGGTDLLVKIRAGQIAPSVLVDVSDLDSLRGISEIEGGVEIGAATPEQTLIDAPLVAERLPLLQTVLGVLGSVQIRNRGTLGGNLVNASPAADSAIPLLLYDAQVVLRSATGDERILALDAFLLGPGQTALASGEIVRAIRVPVPDRPLAPFFHKVGKRRALTIAIASVGALIGVSNGHFDEVRLAAGSVAPVPLRLRDVETHLRGVELTDRAIGEAARLATEAVSPIGDVRASADYRRQVVGELVARALRSTLP